ncbi:MAG TPA: hypothetical protein VGO57_02180 [Verrucomicrobiae bacterium]|jgi:hypothetical protein
MSLQVSDLNLPADKLAQFAKALADASGQNVALQGICDGAAATVSRLTASYQIEDADITNWARSIALYRAYAQAQFGEIPKAIVEEYTETMKELNAIAAGERTNIPKVPDDALAGRAGKWGSGQAMPGRMPAQFPDQVAPEPFSPPEDPDLGTL